MRIKGTLLCLVLVIISGVWLFRAMPLSRKPSLVSGRELQAAGLSDLLQRATVIYQAGNYAQASQAFSEGYQSAVARGQTDLAGRFLWGMANCDFVRHRYQAAIESYLAARQIFESIGATHRITSVDGSLASVFRELGEYDAAIEAARRALAGAPPADPFGHRARTLVTLADLHSVQGKWDRAEVLFSEAIREAARFDDPELLAAAWAHFGYELFSRKQLARAEEAFLEAFRIRKLRRLPSLPGSYLSLGLLRLEQGDLRSASTLLDLSIAESRSQRGRVAQWRFYHARGRLRLAEGKLRQAYDDFRLALESARNYRLAVPSSDAARVSVEGVLQQVYASFVETGNRLYVETRQPRLARETLEAVEENRACSLAAGLDERQDFRRKAPPAYWDLLKQLQSAEAAALVHGGEGPLEAMRRLRGSLMELEINAGASGAGFSPAAGLLEAVQRKLDSRSVLLSFDLAQPNSWLWAVDRSGASLYRLASGPALSGEARKFRQALIDRDASAERIGEDLYQTLFGALEPRYRSKSRWLLSLDEGLFELPFAALVAGQSRGAPVYLVERHSIQIVSGASLWRSGSKHRGAHRMFVGVGDAIYNAADARRNAQPESPAGWLGTRLGLPWEARAAGPAALGLTRLPASGREIAACGREWDGLSVLLTGSQATKANVRSALESGPAVAHFAAHVLQSPERSSGAMIALSLSESGHDQLLGPAEIGSWNIDVGLVTLSGCSSGAAMTRPGAGLMGLTRAWLMAGARAVVASGWSTPDDVGVFFRRFYRQLRISPRRDASDALRAAQVETLRTGDWRSQPHFWAAYFALGND